MEKNFISEHINLKNPEYLYNKVNSVAQNLIERVPDINVNPYYSACVLLVFVVAGKKNLEKEEIIKYAKQIHKDYVEYTKIHKQE